MNNDINSTQKELVALVQARLPFDKTQGRRLNRPAGKPHVLIRQSGLPDEQLKCKGPTRKEYMKIRASISQ